MWLWIGNGKGIRVFLPTYVVAMTAAMGFVVMLRPLVLEALLSFQRRQNLGDHSPY